VNPNRRIQWQRHSLDGAVLRFDPDTGTNILRRDESTAKCQRQAPRLLQVGLLTPCNLHCSFCYRDTSAPSRLTASFLRNLLRRAADWGVLEVAFGGGEPLLFPGFVKLLHELKSTTRLGINFTTNGTLLTTEILDEMEGAWHEMRLSAYEDNHYRRTLRRMSGRNVGVNWLVTPRNVGMIEPFVSDFLALGARNVLLLGYKGDDPALRLSRGDIDRLKHAVHRLEHWPLRLDVCWYPLFPDLPHLFARPDCGAGDEFLVITPDRAVQPCSFHHERIPFETFEDLTAIYHDLRARKPATHTSGCTRTLFPLLPSTPTRPAARVFVWQAYGSNNSGDWTIVGRFRTQEEAQRAAQSLRELARAHEAYLASAEGQESIKANGYDGSIPTPPLRQFGEAHGFDWSRPGDGLWWEEDGSGAPVLTAGAVGDSVVVYHPYCMGLPEEPFRQLFTAWGATEFGYWQYDRPCLVATAHGQNSKAIEELQKYLNLIAAAKYPSEVSEPPPWGEVGDDPRIEHDEDRRTRLDNGPQGIEVFENSVRLTLSFANIFAGALALDAWLRREGFERIEMELQSEFSPLAPTVQPPREPRTGLFGDVRPLSSRLEELKADQIVEKLFNEGSVSNPYRHVLTRIPVPQLLALGIAQWQSCRDSRNVTVLVSQLIQTIGPPASSWARELWDWLSANNREVPGIVLDALSSSLPPDEVFSLALSEAKKTIDAKFKKKLLFFLGRFKNPVVTDLIDEWWRNPDPNESVGFDWGYLAAESGISWETVRRWIQSGRPLSLIGLDVLRISHEANGIPNGFQPPSRSEFISVLQDSLKRDSAPRASRIVQKLCVDPGPLALG
jgi:MoaA/NifB/PqqE/SkfB family radical SAM enzyme